MSDNGEVVVINITRIKYIVDRGEELKIVLDDNDTLIIRDSKNYQEFLENFE